MTINRDTASIYAGLSTPPQFDNDTSIATTAFVQRALGNMVSSIAIGTNTTLDASYAGKIINVGNPGNIVVTLPAISSVPAGTQFTFFSGSAPTNTITRSGSDLIVLTSGNNVTSVTLGDGDTLILVSYAAGIWIAIGGSKQIGASASFAASLSANGYQKLPSGLIMQWGAAGPINVGTPAVINFPISFPSTVCIINPGGINGGGTPAYLPAISAVSTSSFTMSAINGQTYCQWIAIGY